MCFRISAIILILLRVNFASNAQNNFNDSITSAFQSKDYDKVIEYVTLINVNNSLNTKLSIKALEAIGQSYYFQNRELEALSFLKKALYDNILNNEFYAAYANCYYISECHENTFSLDSALKYSQVGLEQAYLTNKSQAISRALNNLAIIYEKRNNYTEALLLYQKSLEEVKGDTVDYMQTRSNISNCYYKIGLLDSAFKIATEAYYYFDNIENPYWKWLSTYRIAYIEEDYKNELAESYYLELLSISDNDYDKALVEIGLGETLLKKENDSALYYFDIASERAYGSQNSMLLREINFNKARIYLQIQPSQFKLKEALDELRLILDEQSSDRAESLFSIFESKYHLNEGNSALSIASVDSAVLNSRKLNHKDRLADALTQKFNVLNHFGHYKEALEVKEEEIKVREELFNDRSEAVYQILRTQNEMDKQESTIANQQLEIDNNNLQILIMYISIALVISALVFIFWQYRTRSKYAQKLETMFLDSRHRYMNNLLLLKNWFNEGKTDKNDEIISFAQNRIDAISTVNRHLDRLSYNKDTIESKSFLEDISHNLLANREFTSEIENVPINMSVSGPLGMITNEIITNGLKYGEAPYAIRFHKNGGGYLLEIEDHGPGIADPEKQGTGSKVLRLLSRQLKGKLIYQNKADHSPDARGTLVSLNFKG